jgi:phage replication-related protein YjqB (UPF0714/DUF867 family)
VLSELIASRGVVEELVLTGPIGVMAIHGGLEAATAEIASAVSAAAGASRYALIQPTDLRWHVPSTRFDPSHSPALQAFVGHVTAAVSIHGFGWRGLEDTVLVGGRNRLLAEVVGDAVRAGTKLHVVTDLEAIPRGLRGLHPANPVNLPPQGGVQVELSVGARHGDHHDALVASFADAVLSYGAAAAGD